MMNPVTDGGRNPSYEGRFPDETPEMHLIRLAQARRVSELEIECKALRNIKKAADALYSEGEEYDFPSGLGIGAPQEYWDDLADALFPDESAEVIQADLDKVQDSVDRAWDAFNAEINRPEFLPCGHHHSLLLNNAESNDKSYCEYCDCISRRNDAEKREKELAHELYMVKAGSLYF